MEERTCHTVVIGSGCAGLNAADLLAGMGIPVLLVTEDMNAGTSRNTGSDKQTYYKLSLAGDEPDSVGEMARGLCYPDVNGDTALCEAAGSTRSFLRLCQLGVPFPTNEYGEYAGYQTDHDVRRRATSAGPLTSRYMTEALERSVRDHHVEILDHAMAAKILTAKNEAAGLLVYRLDTSRFLQINCANIILCTGGPAHIYRDRVYPESQHGMSSLALLAGADGANLDCWQYGIASIAFRWNLSGSYQQVIPRYVSVDASGDEHEFLADALGEREALAMTFLKGYEWPFDADKKAGSSRVDLLVKAETDRGCRVYLDYRNNPRGYSLEALTETARTYLVNCGATGATPIERLQQMNAPAIDLYRAHGIDLARERLEIRVCAQHHNGGIAVDQNWQTSIPGLYVCGEAAGTFGRRRPGGTALNSTQVGSMRAAEHIAQTRRDRKPGHVEMKRLPLLPQGDIAALTAKLQAEMSRVAAFERDPAGMEALSFLGVELFVHSMCARETDTDIRERLLLQDIIVTQEAVLSAMLAAEAEEPGTPGVMMTHDFTSRRVPARPMPDRDLWFERVWRAYRERIQ